MQRAAISSPQQPSLSKGGGRGLQRRLEIITAWFFLAPNLIGFLAFSFLPVLAALVLSFFTWNLATTPQFVGLANYKGLTQDPVFWSSLARTFEFVVLNIPLQIGVALILAIALNQKLPGMKAFRTMFIIPWVSTPVAIALVWDWLFNDNFGLINVGLNAIGLPSVQWLTSQTMALPSVVIVNVWQYAGFTMMLLLAGLQGIPGHLYEAAAIDGATKWRQHLHITLPLLRPVLFFVVVTSIIGSFQVFDIVYIMTQGGPGDATRVYYLYLYQQAFQFSNIGTACAMAVILFLVILAVTVGQMRLFGERVSYEMG